MAPPGTEGLPAEADVLFASDDFVAERHQIVRELRAAGRRDDAERVAKLRKPPKRVVAANRASRALPLQARAATAAAEALAAAQAAGDRSGTEKARARLTRAVDQLVDRAVAEQGGDRLALSQVIRAALTSADGRRHVAEGSLAEMPEPSGFEALAGLTITARRAAERPRARRRVDAQQARLEQQLRAAREELRAAEQDLRDAERAEATARRARETAERRAQAARAAVDRLGRRS